MPKYIFVINGQNFKINFEGKIQKVGFYTTRRINNNDVGTAEKVALDLIRAELDGLVLNDRVDQPVVYVESVREVESFEGDLVPGSGFTWYDETNEENWLFNSFSSVSFAASALKEFVLDFGPWILD